MNDFENQISDIQKLIQILTSKKKPTEYEKETLSNSEYELKRAEVNIEYHDKTKNIKGEFEDLLENARKENPKYDVNSPMAFIPKKIYISSYEQAIKKGLDFDKSNEREIALEYYDYAIEKNITDERAFSLRGFCLQSLGFILDAIDDFTKAIALAPDDCNLYFGRGNSYFSIKDYTSAVENGKLAVYYAKINERFFEGYTAQAKAMGFQSAQSLYEFYINIWEVENNSDSDKIIESLHKKMMQSGDESSFAYVEKYQNKKQIENRDLFKRRPK